MAIGFAAWSAWLLQPAWACSLFPLTPHTLDPEEEAGDATPPGVPVLSDLRISRQPRLPECGSGNSCDGTGIIRFRIMAPADDRTPGAEMGYLIELVGDEPSVFPPEVPVRVTPDGEVFFHFSDENQRLDFTLSVRAMDLGGNLGEPAMLEVDHGGGLGCPGDGGPPPQPGPGDGGPPPQPGPGDGGPPPRPGPGDGGSGCSAAGQSSPVALAMALLALRLVVRRRRAAI